MADAERNDVASLGTPSQAGNGQEPQKLSSPVDSGSFNDDTSRVEAKQPVAATKATLCGVCSSNPPKYKCPRCYLPYCSVACNKVHRENHPPDPEPPEPSIRPDTTANEQTNPQSDSSNPFHVLERSEKLRHLFRKYPSLPTQLLEIYEATQPPQDEANGATGIAASVMRNMNKKEAWNHDMGIKSGKEALRKAKRANGENGEAIREYCELILYELNNDETSMSNTGSFIQKQVAAEDTKLIERLIAQEKR